MTVLVQGREYDLPQVPKDTHYVQRCHKEVLGISENYIVGQACDQQSSDLAQEERSQALLTGRRAGGDPDEGEVELVSNVSKSTAHKDYLHLRDGQD